MRAFICSMHSEHKNVLSSLGSIIKNFKDAFVITMHSFDKYSTELKEIMAVSDIYIKLPDLSQQYDRYAFPSYAISRNYSIAFQELYCQKRDLRYAVCFTGDTLITDASNFDRLFAKMTERGKVAAVSQAIGQNFHAADSDPINGKCEGRPQGDNTTDFACSMFAVDGKFAMQTRVFANISITNPYTTEQILGDELARVITKERFKEKVLRLNEGAPNFSYAYNDGVKYHQHRDL